MRKAMLAMFGLLLSGAAWGQAPIQQPAGCGDAPLGTVCKLTFPNGNTIQTLADGTTWGTVKNSAGDRVSVQLPAAQSTGTFSTFMIANRDTDIVNGPQSDKTQIQGDCRSKTYRIMGGVSFSGKDGSGYPMDVLSYSDLVATGHADEVRSFQPDTNVSLVFAMVCR